MLDNRIPDFLNMADGKPVQPLASSIIMSKRRSKHDILLIVGELSPGFSIAVRLGTLSLLEFANASVIPYRIALGR